MLNKHMNHSGKQLEGRWRRMITSIRNNVDTCCKIEIGPIHANNAMFVVYQKNDITGFTTKVYIEELTDEYRETKIIENWLDPYKYRVVLLGLSTISSDVVLGVTKTNVIEQLLGLILPKYYSESRPITARVVMKANNVGVKLLTLEDNNGYRANVHIETVMIAIKLGMLHLTNAKLTSSKRALTGETISILDKEVINYNNWLKNQKHGADFNYMHPSKCWQNTSMY